MYNKIFTKILDSSIWLEPAHVRIVWITMIAMQDKDGMVALSSVGNVAVRARVTLEEAADAISRLESPDPHNPGQEHDGRRIERVPGTGWVILNSAKYRAIVTAEESRRLNRERVQRFRERERERCNQTSKEPARCNGGVMQAVAYAATALSEKISDGGGGGFGVATVTTPPNEFDINTTKMLEAAVRKLPPRRTGVAGAKPSTWVEHLRLLRVRDKVPEADIHRVMVWYADHIGEEFVPVAFSGEAFRKKWEALERACNRDRCAVAVITPQATAIARRLAGLGWPKGTAKALPGAAQTCLTAYAAWKARWIAFHKRLAKNNLAAHHDEKERRALLAFSNYLSNKLPSEDGFVELWLRAVHERVGGWEAWSGDLGACVFKPEAKQFATMGRAWACAFCNNGDRWDRFVHVMDREVCA